MTIAICPDPEVLSQFLLGRLTPEACEEIAVHVEGCAGCVTRLGSLSEHDTMTEALRSQPTCQNDLDTGLIQRLIERGNALRMVSASAEAALPGADSNATVASQTVTLQPSIGSSGASRGAGETEDLSALLAPPQGSDEVGRLGPYRVLEVLGVGGMGAVFRAFDPQLNRPVALKVMRPAVAAKPSARQRFLSEGKAMAAIEHDHVVHVNHVGEEGGVPYLVMPLLRGESLNQCLQRENALPVAEVLRIGREIAEALAAAHERGLIHRDVKPGNVWLEEGSGRVKVLDFGLVRATDEDSHVTAGGTMLGTPAFVARPEAEAAPQAVTGPVPGLTEVGTVLGTLGYASPEQLRGDPVDARADLFSLGCVLYRMSTGRLPFEGPNTTSTLSARLTRPPRPPAEIVPTLPEGLCSLIMRLLAKEREDRPESAAEVVEALRSLEKGSASRAPVMSGRPRRRRLLAAVVAALLLLGVAVGVAAVIVINLDAERQFVVETDDPDLSFKVNKGVVTLEDSKTGRKHAIKVVRRDKGEYELDVTDVRYLTFPTKTFSIKRGDKVIGVARLTPKELPELTAEQIEWVYKTAKLPVEDQLKEVQAKLKEVNPGFEGKRFGPTTYQGHVVRLKLKSAKLKDLWPMLALKELTSLEINGEDRDKSLLTDLPPLKGLTKLTKLDCSNNQVSDLSPLQVAPLQSLRLNWTMVTDLRPLEEMASLQELALQFTPVSDLSPLKGLPLESLGLGGCWNVSDLSPLTGMRLVSVDIRYTKVTDLSPLAGAPLVKISCDLGRVRNLEVLRGIKTLETINGAPVANFWNAWDAKKE
jgi:serine/threonine protein kinase